MKSLRLFTYSSAVALLLSAATVAAQESPYKFEFHGFVVGSMYYQDQAFLNAQGQGLTLSAPAPTAELGGDLGPPDSGSLIGGDVRQSRFSFGVTGPSALGGTPRGYLELDFFGPTGGGNFGPEQALPRIRVALAELKLGTTVIQVGQQNQLVVPQIPASIAHIANPITYAAGTIGWRTPGVRVTHTMPAGPGTLELAVEVVKNKWSDAQNGAVNPSVPVTPDEISLGEADGSVPMFQARAKADGKAGNVGYSAYLVGVYHSVDLKGMGDTVTPPTAGDSIDGYVLQVGGRVNVSMLTLAGNFYVGNGTGNMLGSNAHFGDIADMGLWAQAGVNLTKEFSVWATYGLNKPDEDDVRKWAGDAGSRINNQLIGGMVRYAQAGYQVGVEALHYTTTWTTGPGTDHDSKALQVIASAGYFF